MDLQIRDDIQTGELSTKQFNKLAVYGASRA